MVVDSTGSRLQHVLQLNLSHIRQMIYYGLNATPHHILRVHFINPAPFMPRILKIIKSFINEKPEILVHENLKDFFQYVPAELLPNEYEGGKAGSIDELNGELYKQ